MSDELAGKISAWSRIDGEILDRPAGAGARPARPGPQPLGRPRSSGQLRGCGRPDHGTT